MADCTQTSVGFIPLLDGAGLYPDGSNAPPASHVERGQILAHGLADRLTNVLLSVGMSNTREEFDAFLVTEAGQTDRAENLTLVNGGQDGHTATLWSSTRGDAYQVVDARLATAGRVPADVGVIWIKLTNVVSQGTLAQWRAKLVTELKTTLINLREHFPNALIILFSSRIYGGYGVGTANPEPYAYETGLVFKELITEHLNGTLHPDLWFGWGPYLWADGLTPRSDGLTWACSDFEVDGLHPGPVAEQKVADLLSAFLRADAVARVWFLQPLPGQMARMARVGTHISSPITSGVGDVWLTVDISQADVVDPTRAFTFTIEIFLGGVWKPVCSGHWTGAMATDPDTQAQLMPMVRLKVDQGLQARAVLTIPSQMNVGASMGLLN